MLDSVGSQPLRSCYLFHPTAPMFVLLGRYGDIIQVLPCWREIYLRTGFKPQVMVSHEYANLFQGVSYVEPYPIREHWWMGMPKARQIAEALSPNVIVPQWWNDDPVHAKMIADSARGNFVIQCHGVQWGVDTSKWPDYGTSMAARCGFTREEWLALPLVFDQRDPDREARLWDQVVGEEDRPVILYNFSGISSPFQFAPEVTNTIRNHFGRRFRFVNLGSGSGSAGVRATRIYDLLGLYDRAAGILTSDTATLHLAAASPKPYIAFRVGGWTSSVPKGNCDFACFYSEVPSNMQLILDTMGRWA